MNLKRFKKKDAVEPIPKLSPNKRMRWLPDPPQGDSVTYPQNNRLGLFDNSQPFVLPGHLRSTARIANNHAIYPQRM